MVPVVKIDPIGYVKVGDKWHEVYADKYFQGYTRKEMRQYLRIKCFRDKWKSHVKISEVVRTFESLEYKVFESVFSEGLNVETCSDIYLMSRSSMFRFVNSIIDKFIDYYNKKGWLM